MAKDLCKHAKKSGSTIEGELCWWDDEPEGHIVRLRVKVTQHVNNRNQLQLVSHSLAGKVITLFFDLVAYAAEDPTNTAGKFTAPITVDKLYKDEDVDSVLAKVVWGGTPSPLTITKDQAGDC